VESEGYIGCSSSPSLVAKAQVEGPSRITVRVALSCLSGGWPHFHPDWFDRRMGNSIDSPRFPRELARIVVDRSRAVKAIRPTRHLLRRRMGRPRQPLARRIDRNLRRR
jgi:hypothetical protein